MNAFRPAPVRADAARPSRELTETRARLAEADETLRAIRTGEVDTMVVAGKRGDRVFTLEDAGHAYRLLIESMNEGAVMLTADMTILYANQCFAAMVKHPLEQVTGSSLRRFLSDEHRAMLKPLLKQAGKTGAKIQVMLNASDDSKKPVQISIRSLVKNGPNGATIGMVVTDMTEARRSEEMLRALTHRVVQIQEAERGSVALELHDNITQLICAVLFRCQALADKLSAADAPTKQEAIKLREMLGRTAEEVERISRNLRPSVLDQLGLVAALRDLSREFAERTGVAVKLAFVQLLTRLPADTELALYRILQETLKNVEKHAHASHVTIRLRQKGSFVQLAIDDDGIGFDPEPGSARRKGKAGLGLLSMRERATYVGGTLKIKSIPRAGTKIEVRIPPTARLNNTSGRQLNRFSSRHPE